MEKLNVGDIVVCVPGFIGPKNDLVRRCGIDQQSNSDEFVKLYAGHGYVPGLIAEITGSSELEYDSITESKYVYFGFDEGMGVFDKALRLATKEEIEIFKEEENQQRNGNADGKNPFARAWGAPGRSQEPRGEVGFERNAGD